MAAHDHDEDLPKTWPFTLGSLAILFAMVWFCLGFALEDVGSELPTFFPIFWLLNAIGVLLMLVGAAYNIRNDRRRQRALAH